MKTVFDKSQWFVSKPTAPPEPRQILDFDSEPYTALTQTRDGIAALIAATPNDRTATKQGKGIVPPPGS
jgi:hypothetical protein